MIRFQPPKIVHLTVIGFFVVLLPIVAAVVRGAGSLDKLSRKHRDDMATVVSITERHELLQQQLSDLERVARQFEIIQDPSLLEIFKKRSQEFSKLVEELQALSLSIPEVGPLLADLDALSGKIFADYESLEQSLAEAGKSSKGKGQQLDQEDVPERIETFSSLHELHDRLEGVLKADFVARVHDAKASANEIRSELMVLSFALLPLTLLLIAFFTAIITRPIKQIKRAIVSLGEGEYKERFDVHGPGDLQQLASQLSWLSRKLKAADEEKKRFLRHVSHELKTPLASIKEGVELLEDEVPGRLNENQREVVGILKSGVLSFRGLINNLLDYNLLRRDPQTHAQWVPILDVVREVTDPHRLTADRKKIEIHLEGDPVTIFVDRTILRAALDNLVSNGVHYTPDGGKVRLSWYYESKDRVLRLEVSDTGPGIPKAERDQVFLPFYQGKTQKRGPLKGTGLGLSIARECVESLQGTIKILDSKIGTLFQLRLPVDVRKDAV